MDVEAFKTKYATELDTAKAQLASMSRKLLHLELAGRNPGFLNSRVGGAIACPPVEPFPQDATGEPMVFVAQINLSEVGELPGFPSAGLLQLFLANDISQRGITFLREHHQEGDFPVKNGDGFRLVFRPDTAGLMETDYQPPAAEYPVFTPEFISRPCTILAGEIIEQYPPMTHWKGAQIYEAFAQLPEAEDSLVELADILETEVWDPQLSTGFYLGGFACPLQQDHRCFFEEFQRYDTCVMNFGELPGLELPDMNLAILISGADLRKARFEDTVMIADTD